MAIRNLKDLKAILPSQASLLGLDVGAKTIGVAVSDPERRLARPLLTIKRSRFAADAQRLRAIYEEEKAAGFVIGLPINMDGSEGPRCQSVRQFAANLLAAFACELAFWDERLSTAAVTRRMIEGGVSRKKRRALVDKAAAAYILEGALDFLARAP